MSKNDRKSISVFYSIIKAGLWEQEVSLLPSVEIDISSLKQKAEEQSVVGLIAAGLEHIVNKKLAKQDVLHFVGQALQLEQQNTAMNYFIGVLVDKMREEGIDTILVKGQGVAQCYERPLWRACGDVDFFYSDDNYERAKQFLVPIASSVEKESNIDKHMGMSIASWTVEIHGTLHCGLSSRMDGVLDQIQADTFSNGGIRVWKNGQTDVYLPSPDNDVIFVFTHFLKHFYKGGIGLRQICDWCRLVWKYKNVVNRDSLSLRLASMGLMTEWKAFAAFAVDYLGMPADAMPLYSPDKKWKRKAGRISSFIMDVGNFGHNRDNTFRRKPFLIRKTYSMFRRIGDVFNHARIFPLDSMRFLPSILLNGVKSAARGIG